MISEQEIRDLQREKKSLSADSLRMLSESLARFQASSRFEMLRTLPLSHFIKGKVSGLARLAERSLDDLVTLGVCELCRQGKLSNTSVKRLGQILGSLHGNEEPVRPAAKVVALPHLRAVHSRDGGPKQPTMSSVEAEQRLEEAMYRLRRSARFEELSEQRLGDYWDPRGVSAPFESSLTFRQFSEMKVRALLEKRSFGPEKIHAVLSAVQRALSDSAETAPSGASESAASAPELRKDVPLVHLWKGEQPKISLQARLVLALYNHEATRVSESIGPLAKIIREVPKRLLPAEFLAAWLAEEFVPDIIAPILGVDRNEVSLLCDRAYSKLDRIVNSVASELRSYWEIALRGPGIGSEKLIEIFREPLLSSEFQLALCQVLLGSTGARHPIVFGEDLRHYWSKSPAALQMTVTGLIASFPKHDDTVQQEIEALFPFFDRAIIVSILQRQAYFQEREKMWLKRGDDRA